MKGIFRSLQGFNYRVWAAGALVSNVGTWMQRIAQDWIVLTQLTRRSAQGPLPLFARRLKAARARAGLTQVELGVGAGIDEYSASARVNQYERGKHWPDFGTAARLAAVLRVPTAYFYAEEDAVAELVLRYFALKSQRKRALLDFALRLSDAK
ncbi:MAG: helix-turn-helix transcriptional regulator [Casimicrobiaceae bacterium]